MPPGCGAVWAGKGVARLDAHDEPAGQGENNPAPGVNRLPPARNREAMDDGELIAAMAGGDDAALRELFSRHALCGGLSADGSHGGQRVIGGS